MQIDVRGGPGRSKTHLDDFKQARYGTVYRVWVKNDFKPDVWELDKQGLECHITRTL